MPTNRRQPSTPRGSGPADDITRAVRAALDDILREEQERRDPRQRQERLLARMERFLDGAEAAAGGAGGRAEEEDEDEEHGDEGRPASILDLLSGGGRR